MPIQSYLVYPTENSKQSLTERLNSLRQCEVLESTNEDIIILVTDTKGKQDEGQLQHELSLIPQISSMALVYAHNEQADEQADEQANEKSAEQ